MNEIEEVFDLWTLKNFKFSAMNSKFRELLDKIKEVAIPKSVLREKIDELIKIDEKLTGNINDKFRKQWVVNVLNELKESLLGESVEGTNNEPRGKNVN